jgi:hypothetical protein
MHCFTVYDKHAETLERDRKEDNFYNNSNSETEVFGLAVNPEDIWRSLKTFGLVQSKRFGVDFKTRVLYKYTSRTPCSIW